MTSNGQRDIERNEAMRGGKGHVLIEHLLGEKELNGKCRMYAKVTLEPHCSIGYHVHNNESETYYILCGQGEYNDNGSLMPVKAGDCTFTGNGFGHGIENTGSENLELMALIILD